MDLSYSEEAERFRASIRQWLGEVLPAGWFDGRRPTGAAWDSFCQDWNGMLHRTGWSCPTWPVEYGGKGLSPLEAVILTEELAESGAPIQPPAGGEILVGPTILHWGDDAPKGAIPPPDRQRGRRSGARASPSPMPARIWRLSRPPPYVTARIGSSTERRSGPAKRPTPT